jgi:membrane protease YdiL (CAAX protease family)
VVAAPVLVPLLVSAPRRREGTVAHVVAALIAWLFLAGLLRFGFFLVRYLRREASRPPLEGAPPAASKADDQARSDDVPSAGKSLAGEQETRPRSRVTRWLAPWPRPSPQTREWRPGYALAALVLAQLSATAAWVLLSVLVSPPSIVSTLLIEGALLLTMLPLCRSRHVRATDLGIRSAPGARSVALAVVGFLAYVVSSALWVALVHPPHGKRNFAGVASQPTSVIVVSALAAIVLAPTIEEIFWRGFLYRSLRNRMSVWPAALAAGALFGLCHWQYPLAVRPELMFFGVIAALMYERTGSLLPGIALHSFVDSSGFWTSLTGRATPVVVVFAAIAVVLVARPPLRALGRLIRGQPAFHDYTVPVSVAIGSSSRPELVG